MNRETKKIRDPPDAGVRRARAAPPRRSRVRRPFLLVDSCSGTKELSAKLGPAEAAAGVGTRPQESGRSVRMFDLEEFFMTSYFTVGN